MDDRLTAVRSSWSTVCCLFREHSFKDRVYVAQISSERKHSIDLCRRKLRGDVSVTFDQRSKLATFVPNFHRVALHPFVGRFARHTFLSQQEQQVTAEDEPAG